MLTLLLDEHISPIVAEQALLKEPTARIVSISHWHGGEFLNTDDALILEAVFQENVTLVTYDQSTIRPVLKEWGEQGLSHGGVVFIDDKSITQNNYGGLVNALLQVWEQMKDIDFTDGVLFLHPVLKSN